MSGLRWGDPAAALHFLVPFSAETAGGSVTPPYSLPHTFVGVYTALPPPLLLPVQQPHCTRAHRGFSKIKVNNLIKLALYLEHKNERWLLVDRIRVGLDMIVGNK